MKKLRDNKFVIIIGIAIVLAVLLAYIPAMLGGFIWDDDANLTKNPLIRTPDGLAEIWSNPSAIQQYYPLTHSTFWLEYHIWGLRPLGYHLINVLLHALSAILLGIILTRLSVPGAWLAAIVFALHPVHVESVAWITERKNTLSGFFYLSSVLAYIRFAGLDIGSKPSKPTEWRYYGLALVLFICAVLSKTAVLMLPVVLLLLIWWKHGRLNLRDGLRLLPMFVISVGAGLLTIWLEKHHAGAKGDEWAQTFADRCLVAGRVFWFYIGKLCWPSKLTFIYPRWEIDSSEIWQYIFPVAAVVLVIILWLLRNRLGKSPLVAVLYFGITLSPAMGFFNIYFMRYSFVQDHFQYLPSIGIISLLAAMFWMCFGMFLKLSPIRIILSSMIVIVLGTLTWCQGRIYRDEWTIWRDTLAKNPSAWMAHDALAALLAREKKYDEAADHYYEALRIYPNHPEAHRGLGVIFAERGKLEKAEEYLTVAIRMSPGFGDAHYNLGTVFARQRKFEKACAEYRKALEINPYDIQVYDSMGLCLMLMGKPSEAKDCYKKELRFCPRNARRNIEIIKAGEAASNKTPSDAALAHYNQGIKLDAAGKIDQAVEEYRKAIKLKPVLFKAHNNLGVALKNQGLIDEAIQEYREAIRIKPNFGQAHNNLAIALYIKGDCSEAWREVHTCQKYGYQPHPGFIQALSEKFPEPLW